MQSSTKQSPTPYAPPSGANARLLAARIGPSDETHIEQIADYISRDETQLYREVSAERLRLLADRLKAEAEQELNTEALARFISRLRSARDNGTPFVTLYPVDIARVHELLSKLAVDHDATLKTLEREREHTIRLESIVRDLAAQAEAAQQPTTVIAFAFSEGNTPDSLTPDIASDLAVALAELEDEIMGITPETIQ